MITLLITSAQCGACKNFKGNGMLASDLEHKGMSIGQFSYKYSDVKKLLSLSKKESIFLSVEFKGLVQSGVSEVSYFYYTNERSPDFNSDGKYYIKQIVYRERNGKVIELHRFITETSSLTLQEKPRRGPESDWETFLKSTIPLEQIKKGVIFYPQIMFFDSTLWMESIKTPDIPLYRRYHGLKTQEEGDYKPVMEPDINGRLKYNHMENLFENASLYLSNPEELLPMAVRTEKSHKTPVSTIKVTEVPKIEFIPYTRKRR